MEVSSVLEKTKKIIKDSLTIVILITLVVLTIVFIDTGKVTVIHKFNVSDKLSKSGLDGEAVSKIVYGKIKNIYEESRTSRSVNIEGYANNVEHAIEFEGIDFNKVLRVINQFLGKSVSVISGVIYEEANKLKAVISIDGIESRKINGSYDSMDKFLETIGKAVVEEAEPYILARYISTSEGYKNPRIIELIYKCLSNQNMDDDHWALNLWGNYYYDQGRFEEAEKKYQEAYELAESRRKNFYVALSNLGAAQMGLNRIEQAKKTLAKAIRLEDEYYYSYFTLGVINIREGQYALAINNLEKSLERNRTNPGTYYHLSRGYWFNKQELEKSIRYAVLSRRIYRERGMAKFSTRSQEWINRICEESIEDTSKLLECKE